MPASFANHDLRGRSFKWQDLSGADFSGADIRGADFRDAILVNADFNYARGGVRKRVLLYQFVVSFLVSALLNFSAIFISAMITAYPFSPGVTEKFGDGAGLAILFIQATNFWTIGRQGLTAKTLSRIAALATIGVGVGVAIAIAGAEANANPNAAIFVIGADFAFSGIAAVTVGISAAAAGAFSSASTTAAAGAIVGVIAIGVASATANAIAAAVGVGVGFCGAVAVGVVLLNFYSAWRVRREDEKFSFAREFGLWFGGLGGTSFRGANLSASRFGGAMLAHCNFTHADVLGTDWRGAIRLDLARRSGTILQDKAVRELCVTGQGGGQIFRGKNLKGAGLKRGDLRDADFTEADLSGAILEHADLTGANLTKVQALGVDFHGATLTGVCLEAWNIDSSTKLEGVVCDYVYLLNGQRERRPSSGVFGPGEFAKLFQEVLNTVDLIFRNGIDWRAFMLSLENLKIAYQDEDIQVQAIENKGDGVFVVRLATPPEIDKEAVHGGFTQDYVHQLALLESRNQAQLEVIDLLKQQNVVMTEIVKTLADRHTEIQNIVTTGGENKIQTVGGDVKDSTLNQGRIGTEVN